MSNSVKSPKELNNIEEKILLSGSNKVEKKVVVSFDCKQHTMRIPKEISELLNIETWDYFVFILDYPSADPKAEPELKFKIIKISESERRKKQRKKDAKKKKKKAQAHNI